MELVAADIGGSHARFALADVEGGQVTNLGEAITLRTTEHASLQTAWETFGAQIGRALPRAAAIAVAWREHDWDVVEKCRDCEEGKVVHPDFM